MTRPFTIRFWGVRGSIATSGPAFAGVGGNTSCIEVRAGDELIILDAGTGVFPLGQSLAHPVSASFLFTHFHWDHIQGLPLFRPAYVSDNRFTLYAQGISAAQVGEVFARQMQAPNFPVSLASLAAHIEFRSLRPREDIQIGPARIRTAELNHPQSCLGYRISVGNASVVMATDTEPQDCGMVDPEVVELARGADVLIHDAQYTQPEYDGCAGPARKGWGHSTHHVACRVARWAGVKQLILFHHDPTHDDREMESILAAARALFPNTIIAREGLTVDVQSMSRAAAQGAEKTADAVATPPGSLYAA